MQNFLLLSVIDFLLCNLLSLIPPPDHREIITQFAPLTSLQEWYCCSRSPPHPSNLNYIYTLYSPNLDALYYSFFFFAGAVSFPISPHYLSRLALALFMVKSQSA